MNLNEKELLEFKADKFIQQYELKEERRLQANLRVKKQVMLDVVSSRQQSRDSNPTFQTLLSDKSSLPSMNPIKQPFSEQPFATSRVDELSRGIDLQEVTFNAKKRNRSLNEQITFNRSYGDELEQQVEHPEEGRGQAELSESEIRRKIRLKLSQLKQQDEMNASYASSKSPFQRPVEPPQQIDPPQQIEPLSQIERLSAAQISTIPNNISILQRSKARGSGTYGTEGIKDMKGTSQVIRQRIPLSYLKEEESPERQEEEEEQERGVFLTVDEEQSMEFTEAPKNYAFQVKMGREAAIETIEELRKLKIEDLERKRKERILQFRKNESEKHIELPKQKNNSLYKYQRKGEQESERSETRSKTIDRKDRPKTDHKLPKPPLELLRPQIPSTPKIDPYVMKLPPRQGSSQIQPKSMSPFSQSKAAEGRPRNPGKGQVTSQSPGGREKSSNKDKDKGKGSFTRQSNKKLMINAIMYTCLPGDLNRREREKLIDVLEVSEHEFFVFLFKQYSRKIVKGIYTLDSSMARLERVYGEKAPFQIAVEKVQEFYRFDSGSREFKKVDGCKSFSLAVHAIDLR